MNGNLGLFGILAILCIIVGIVLIVISYYKQYYNGEGALYLLFAGVACIIMAISGFSLVRTKQAEIMIDNGAKVYVDGQEVDADTIDMNEYDLKNIKDGNVILSRKERIFWTK